MSNAFPASGAAGGRLVRFMTVSLARELGVLLFLSVMFPFMIHILPVPGDAQLGARLLPIFYAPLLAALIGRIQTAWTLALVAPWLNCALTSHPAPRGAALMMVELLVFVLVLRTLLRAGGARWFWACPAYFAGMAAAALIATVYPPLIGNRPAVPWLAQSVTLAAPGIAVLLLINWLVLRTYPPGPSDRGPLAA